MRSHHKRKLTEMLGASVDEDFFHMLWAANCLQGPRPGPATRIFLPGTYEAREVGPKVPTEYRLHPWELETLANMLLSIPKNFVRKGREHRFRITDFSALKVCVGRLRSLENKEYGLGPGGDDILLEMSRLAQRQFPWQTGFANNSNIYRNLYVYGQGICADSFKAEHGISIERYFFIAFALYSTFQRHASITSDDGCPALEITRGELETVLKLISISSPKARANRLLKKSALDAA